MGSDKVHSFQSLGHKTLRQMADEAVGGNVKRVEAELAAIAVNQGRNVVAPVEASPEVIAPKNPAPEAPQWQRGRIAVFMPTAERVTIIRERVGQNYNGAWVHEVTNRDGKTFLAADVQLKGQA